MDVFSQGTEVVVSSGWLWLLFSVSFSTGGLSHYRTWKYVSVSCCTLAVCVESGVWYPQNFTLCPSFCVSTPLPSKVRDLSEHTAQIHQQNKEKVKWKALNVISSFIINGINYYSVVFNHFIKWNIFHVHVPLALFPNIGVADVEPDAESHANPQRIPKKSQELFRFFMFYSFNCAFTLSVTLIFHYRYFNVIPKHSLLPMLQFRWENPFI